MVAVQALHLSDFHEDMEKRQVITDYISSHDIDFVLFAGDFLNAFDDVEGSMGEKLSSIQKEVFETSGVQEIVAKTVGFYRENDIKSDKDFEELDDDKVNEYKGIMAELLDAQAQGFDEINGQRKVRSAVDSSVEKVHAGFKALSEHAPVYAVLGNHDLTLIYDQLSDCVTFVDKEEEVKIETNDGLEFILKGDTNTYEMPGIFNQPGFQESLQDLFINYLSGWTSFPSKVDDENKKQFIEQNQDQIFEHQEFERTRLGSPNDECDIYLTHKLPHNELARQDNLQPYTGDIALEYSANATVTCGGHFHDGQVNKSTLTALIEGLEAEDAQYETETIDGEEVAVLYMENDDIMEFNPGTNYFLVYGFDENKQVEYVDIFEFVREQN